MSVDTTNAADLAELRERIPPLLKSDDERASLEVRDELAFPGHFEVVFNGKMGLIKKENIYAIRQNSGGLESFLLNFLNQLRANRLQQQAMCPECRGPRYLRWTYPEVQREVHHALQEILLKAGKIDAIKAEANPADLRRRIDAISAYLADAINSHERDNRIRSAPIAALKLKGRTERVLQDHGITMVSQLLTMTHAQIRDLHGVQYVASADIRDGLERNRLKLQEDAS